LVLSYKRHLLLRRAEPAPDNPVRISGIEVISAMRGQPLPAKAAAREAGLAPHARTRRRMRVASDRFGHGDVTPDGTFAQR
jgi:hypothetical protein